MKREKRKERHNSFIAMAVIQIVTLLATSCELTVHEYPQTESSLVRVEIEVDRSPAELYKIMDYVTSAQPILHTLYEWSHLAKAPADYSIDKLKSIIQTKPIDGWDIRVVWELYSGTVKIANGKSTTKILDNYPKFSVEVPIPEGDYTLLAWADYVPSGTIEDYYYNTASLEKVLSMIDKRQECNNNELRDCFCKSAEIKVRKPKYSNEIQSAKVTLTRPQGRYVILSDDYEKYTQLTNTAVENNNAKLVYPSFINIGYNVKTEKPNESGVNIWYNYTPRSYIFNNVSVLIAEDYSFVNGAESVISINMEISHNETGYISTTKNILIPLYANKLTVVLGNFLTDKSNSRGVVVDERFKDEIVIRL